MLHNFMMNGLAHHYDLDESTFIFEDISCDFIVFYFIFQ